MLQKLTDNEHELIHWVDEDDEFADKYMNCDENGAYIEVTDDSIAELKNIRNRWFCKNIKREITNLIERLENR